MFGSIPLRRVFDKMGRTYVFEPSHDVHLYINLLIKDVIRKASFLELFCSERNTIELGVSFYTTADAPFAVVPILLYLLPPHHSLTDRPMVKANWFEFSVHMWVCRTIDVNSLNYRSEFTELLTMNTCSTYLVAAACTVLLLLVGATPDTFDAEAPSITAPWDGERPEETILVVDVVLERQ